MIRYIKGGDKIKTKYEAQNKYLKEKSKRYVIQCMLNTELDIINHLASQENKAGYIKSLIRADMLKTNSTSTTDQK